MKRVIPKAFQIVTKRLILFALLFYKLGAVPSPTVASLNQTSA